MKHRFLSICLLLTTLGISFEVCAEIFSGSETHESILKRIDLQVELLANEDSGASSLMKEAQRLYRKGDTRRAERSYLKAQSLLIGEQRWHDSFSQVEAELLSAPLKHYISEKTKQAIFSYLRQLRDVVYDERLEDPQVFEKLTIGYLLVTDFIALCMGEHELKGGVDQRVIELRQRYKTFLERASQSLTMLPSADVFAVLHQTQQQLRAEILQKKHEQDLLVLRWKITALADVAKPDDQQSIRLALKQLDFGLRKLTSGNLKQGLMAGRSALRALFPESTRAKFGDDFLNHLLRMKLVVSYLKQSDDFSNALTKSLEELLLEAQQVNPKQARKLSKTFKKLVNQALSDPSALPDDFSETAPKVMPGVTKDKMNRFLEDAKLQLGEIRKIFKTNQTYLQTWESHYNDQVLNSLNNVEVALSQLEWQINYSRERFPLENLFRFQRRLKLLLNWYVDATLRRASNVEDYGKMLLFKLYEIGSRKEWTIFYSHNDLEKLGEVFNQDRQDAVFNSLATRENGYRLAIAATVVSFGIGLIPSLSGSISAGVASDLGWGARATFLGISGLNLTERYHRDGWVGLANLNSLIDMFIVFSCLPRVIPGLVNAPTWYGRLAQSARNHVGMFQSEAASLVWISHGLTGAYEIMQAEAIAKRMQLEQGVEVSANQIRARGVRNILIAVFFQRMNARIRNQGQARYGKKFSEVTAPWKLKNSPTLNRVKNVFRYPAAVRDAYRSIAHSTTNRWLKPFAIVGGVANASVKAITIPLYNWILANEAILFSYTNYDGNYFSKIFDMEPAPALREGEIAVLAVGFDPSDILYPGAHASSSTQMERQKYGDQFHKIDFISPLAGD